MASDQHDADSNDSDDFEYPGKQQRTRGTERRTMRASLTEAPSQAARPVFMDAEAMKEKLRQSMCTPQYDVANFYKEHGLWQAIARSHIFANMTLAVIGFNAFWIWIDTDYNDEPSLLEAQPIFQIVEFFFCVYFSYEWVVRFMAFKYKRNCMRDAWFCFDTAMVVVMVLETWVMNIVILSMSGDAGSGGLGNASIMRLLRLLRLSRMARMARLLHAMPELLILIKGMIAAMRSVVFTLLLLLVLIYLFGITFAQLLSGSPPELSRGFETVPRAMHTLLLRGTLMDEIGVTVKQLGNSHVIYVLLFYFFVLCSALTVMNMLIGVLCEVVNAVAATEREQIAVCYVRDKLQDTLREGGLDTDGDGLISKDEFAQILENPHAVKTLNDVGVDVFNLVDLQEFIFQEDDEAGNLSEKQLTFCEFMEVVLALRGSNQATVKDIVDLRKFVMNRTKELEHRILNSLAKSARAPEAVSKAASKSSEKSTAVTIPKPASSNDLQADRNATAEKLQEWEVISNTAVELFKDDCWDSFSVGKKMPGETVFGIKAGDWVRLEGFEGYACMFCPDGTTPQLAMRKRPAAKSSQFLEGLERELRRVRTIMDEELATIEKDICATVAKRAEASLYRRAHSGNVSTDPKSGLRKIGSDDDLEGNNNVPCGKPLPNGVCAWPRRPLDDFANGSACARLGSASPAVQQEHHLL